MAAIVREYDHRSYIVKTPYINHNVYRCGFGKLSVSTYTWYGNEETGTIIYQSGTKTY